MVRFKFLLMLLMSGLFVACTTSRTASTDKKSTGKTKTDAYSEVETDNTVLTLADYLRKVPGVSVMGSGDNIRVQVRGAHSVSGTNEPLYIVDRVPVGHNYRQVANMVDVNDIKKVTVLKDSSAASQYGARGTNGVIVITTRKN